MVLTAQALEADSRNSEDAYDLALRAHKLDPSLVPAAIIAARHAAHDGSLRKAARILEKTWNLTPHPDLAEAYGHIRQGDSALDRLKRIRSLVGKSGGIESAVALATAAIEALEWKAAREALGAFAHDRPQARICGLMAEIEEGEFGDKGRAREWLSRAVRAPRDPAWTADGFISRTWLPVSPVTGELGGFKWKVPVEGIAYDEPEADEPAGEDAAVPGDDAVAIEVAKAPADDLESPEIEEQVEDVPAEDEPTEADSKPEETPEEQPDIEPAEPEQVEPEETGPEPEPVETVEVEDVEPETEPVEAEDIAEAPADSAEETDTGKKPEPDKKTVKDSNAEKAAAALARQPDDPGPDDDTGKKPDKNWL